MNVLMGLIGIISLTCFAILLSSNWRAINIRTVSLAFAIQASFGAFVLYLPFGQNVLITMASGVQWVIDSSQSGIDFLFGGLVSDRMTELFGQGGFIFALRVLPVIIFFSSLIAVLYHLGLIALMNEFVTGVAGLFGFEGITIQILLGYVFSPVAFLIGVPWGEALQAGSFIGQKIIVNEFVAYINFVEIKDTLSEHTQAIITFALCGFANLSAIAILVGGLGAIAPNRRQDLARLGFKAIIAGSLSNLMSATLAGIFISLV
jgi:nucleoside permease NupC